MYVYFHDVPLHSGKNFHLWNRIEARLNNLGIHGRKVSITPLSNNLKAILQDEMKRGVHTVVAVGNDEMFLRLANAVLHYPKLVLAYIPFEQTYISRRLGIAPQELACDILSSRILHKFSTIKFNKDEYSLAPVEFSFDDLKVADSQVEWLVKGIEPGYKLLACGDYSLWADHYREKFNLENISLAADKVNLLIYKGQKSADQDLSVLSGESFFLKNRDGGQVLLPKTNYSKEILQIRIVPENLPVIVGKNRLLE